jgi:hypothetical protein
MGDENQLGCRHGYTDCDACELRAENARLRGEVERLTGERDYFSAYAGDLAAIDRALDEIDAPHHPVDGASLSPTRIRELGGVLHGLRTERDEWRKDATDWYHWARTVTHGSLASEAMRGEIEARINRAPVAALEKVRDAAERVGAAFDGENILERVDALVALRLALDEARGEVGDV